MASSADTALALPQRLDAAGRSGRRRSFRVLPGFGLTMGYTLVYVSLIVLIPLSAAFLRSAELGPARFWHVVTTPRVLASLRLSFGAALIAAALNGVFGFIIAWALTRQRFPGRRLFDAIIDLPFALPTAVAGIALTALYAPTGWIGALLLPLGIRVAYTPLGIVVALAFVIIASHPPAVLLTIFGSYALWSPAVWLWRRIRRSRRGERGAEKDKAKEGAA